MAVRVWNGAGLDELANNGANWVGGVAPNNAADIAQFDGTSAKDCTWNIGNGNYDSFNVTADYHGTITEFFAATWVMGTFAGGTLDFNDLHINIFTVLFSGTEVFFTGSLVTGNVLNGITMSGGVLHLDTSTINPMGGWLNTGAIIDCGTSLVDFTWSASWTIAHNSEDFYDLSITGNAVGMTITIGAGTLTVTNDLLLNTGWPGYTIDLATNNPDCSFGGDVTVDLDALVTHGTGTVIFTGTITYTDGNAAPVDWGTVHITGSFTMASGIHFGAVTISGTFDAGGAYTITCDGATWTNSGTFVCQTSLVSFTATTTISGMDGTANTFYDLTVQATGSVTVATKVGVAGTTAGVRSYAGNSSVTTYIHDLTVVAGGAFTSVPGGEAICTTPWWIGG